MKEPKPRRSTIRSGRGRQAFLLGALLVLVAMAQGRDGAADDGMRADAAGGGWQGTELAARPIRLPPAEWASYDAEAMFEPLPPSDSYVGYNSGFVIANHGLDSPATSDFPFFLRVNSWLQLRHTLFNAADPREDLNLFSIERLRLGLGGHAYSPNLKYFFQFDGNSDQASQAIFLDYFVTYDLGCELFGYHANKLGVKAGKWKVPFSRSREESGRRLQFTERSTSNLFFDLNRSIGVGLFGELDAWSTPVRFETAIFNGFQSGADTDIRDAGLDQNFAWSARVYTDLFSEFGGDGEPDLSWHPEPALRLGFGLAGTRVDAIGANEFSQPRVVDSGARPASARSDRV
ncbi:MAG: OprO/OprP family phosphate-selective porin [Pirellulaceae bacterium]|nr:OprO/OprP family phosphate-selective porin [Pirellulaceae bacterium]